MKKIFSILMCAVLLLALVSCGDTSGNTPDDNSVKINGVALSNYKIEAANEDAENASALLFALLTDCGVEFSETAENSIVVGDSKTALAENEYVYEADGKTIYINGNGADACEAAVLLFVYNIAGYDGYNKDAISLTSASLDSVKLTYADNISGKFAPIEYYVSTNGSDDANGSKEAPLASFAGALNAVGKIAGKTLRPITVKFAEGEYVFDETVKITAQNSGKIYSPVEFVAEDGADVTFMGGVKIPASAATKVTDTAIIDRIATPEAKDKIYSIDLSPYFSKIPEVSNQSIDNYYPVQFFVDGKTQTIARYPNVGETFTVNGWATDMEGDGVPFYYVYMPEQAGQHIEKYWPFEVYESKTVFAVGFFSSDAYDEGLSVSEVVKEASELRKDYIGQYYFRTFTQIYESINAGQTFYFHNLLEEIDTAGEYYIDVAAKKLYFYSDGNISDEMYVSRLGENMINITSGSSDISFKNINFAYIRAKAINAQGANNITIDSCDFSCISSNAISFTSTTNSTISNSNISECGRGGIILARCGSVANSTDANITVSNCNIANVNLVKYTGSACVSITNACGVKLANNTLAGNGIDTIIENNVKNITK